MGSREALCSTMHLLAKRRELQASDQDSQTLSLNKDQWESEARTGNESAPFQTRFQRSTGVREMFASTEREGLVRFNLNHDGIMVNNELVMFDDVLLWAEHADLEELQVQESNKEIVILPLPGRGGEDSNVLGELIRETIGEFSPDVRS